MKRCGLLAGLVTLGLLHTATPCVAQDKVYTRVTTEKTEALLKGMNIAFKKTAGKKDGTWFYDFERNNFKVRLHNYEAKDLWIDALFNDQTTLQEINAWNVKAKFSRAVHFKNNEGKDTISLESQIDCMGGVTDGMIRQFINRFDSEVAAFVKHLSK